MSFLLWKTTNQNRIPAYSVFSYCFGRLSWDYAVDTKLESFFPLPWGFVGIEACHEDWQGDPFWDLHMSNYYGP